MTFQADTSNGDLFKRLISGVGEVVNDNVNLEIKKTAYIVRVWTTRMWRWLIFSIEKFFDTYKFTEDINIGVQLGELAKMIRVSENKDQLSFSTKKTKGAEPETFDLTFTDGEVATLHIVQDVIESDADAMEVPSKRFANEVSLPSNQFAKIIADLTVIGTSVQIDCDKNHITFSTTGELGKGQVTLEEMADESSGVRIKAAEHTNDEFALRFLQVFSRCSDIAKDVKLRLHHGLPFQVFYDMG
eukprot:UN33071